MKVKIQQDIAPLYPQMAGDAVATRILHRGDIATLGGIKNEGPRKWIEASLDDGTKGFIAAGTRVFSMINAKLNQPKTTLYAGPSTQAPIGELTKGTEVNFQNMVEQDGQQWIQITDPSGKQGYIDGKTPITQKPIVTRKSGLNNMMIGGGLCVVGTIITIATYTSATSGGGGTYYICWGAIIFGAIQFLQGLYQFTTAPE